MSDEQFALSTSPASSTAPPTEADYEAILAAVMETVRGRWFLSEFGRRNRQSDTRLVLAAIERLESMMRGERESPSFERIRFDIREMAKAIALTKREIAAIKPDHEHSGRIGKATEELDSIVQTTEQATSDILAAAEQIQETAWTLREQGVDEASCDEIDHRTTDIYLSCSFQDLTGQRIRKVIQVLRYLEGRINAMLDILGPDETEAPADETAPDGLHDGHATDFDTSLDQAEIDRVMPAVHAMNTGTEAQGAAHASHLVIDHAPQPDHAAEIASAAEPAPSTATSEPTMSAAASAFAAPVEGDESTFEAPRAAAALAHDAFDAAVVAPAARFQAAQEDGAAVALQAASEHASELQALEAMAFDSPASDDHLAAALALPHGDEVAALTEPFIVEQPDATTDVPHAMTAAEPLDGTHGGRRDGGIRRCGRGLAGFRDAGQRSGACGLAGGRSGRICSAGFRTCRRADCGSGRIVLDRDRRAGGHRDGRAVWRRAGTAGVAGRRRRADRRRCVSPRGRHPPTP